MRRGNGRYRAGICYSVVSVFVSKKRRKRWHRGGMRPTRESDRRRWAEKILQEQHIIVFKKKKSKNFIIKITSRH